MTSSNPLRNILPVFKKWRGYHESCTCTAVVCRPFLNAKTNECLCKSVNDIFKLLRDSVDLQFFLFIANGLSGVPQLKHFLGMFMHKISPLAQYFFLSLHPHSIVIKMKLWVYTRAR